tara:strand:- start:278 stop:487 length:210 start_codon:yes stop_codon:yes gene_type:complete
MAYESVNIQVGDAIFSSQKESDGGSVNWKIPAGCGLSVGDTFLSDGATFSVASLEDGSEADLLFIITEE